MIELIVKLVFLPFRLLIDCSVGCLVTAITMVVFALGVFLVLNCLGII